MLLLLLFESNAQTSFSKNSCWPQKNLLSILETLEKFILALGLSSIFILFGYKFNWALLMFEKKYIFLNRCVLKTMQTSLEELISQTLCERLTKKQRTGLRARREGKICFPQTHTFLQFICSTAQRRHYILCSLRGSLFNSRE